MTRPVTRLTENVAGLVSPSRVAPAPAAVEMVRRHPGEVTTRVTKTALPRRAILVEEGSAVTVNEHFVDTGRSS